jgi:outer membrane protein assembly factor BamB
MKRILLLAAIFLVGCGPKVNPVSDVTVESSGVEITASDIAKPADSDWISWRGPAGNGIAPDQPIPTTWSKDQHVVWQAKVPGRGHGSPVVFGEQVFLATADNAKQQQSVVAFSRANGDLQWQTLVSEGGFPGSSQMHGKSSHANTTLACDGRQLYGAFLAHDKVTTFALDLSGNEIWKQVISTFNSKFGYAPSPTLYKSTVIFAADNRGGGCVAALDRASGKIAWRKSRRAVATYSSPIVATVAGRDQLLISGGNALVSYDPNTGKEIWSCPGVAEATCGTVVWNDRHVFATGGYPESETICVLADGSSKKVWSTSFKAYEPSMVVYDGYLYTVTDKGIAYCVKTATGEEKWKKRLGGSFSASPVICNGLIYVCNDRGKTYVIQASPTACNVVAENQLGTDAYASPAISKDQIFLRVGEGNSSGRQELLFCLGMPPAAT